MNNRPYYCEICRISVSSLETFQNHKRGKDHIKRANMAQKYSGQNEQERMEEVVIPKQNATEIAMRSKAELENLRTKSTNLQRTVRELNEKARECKRNHNDQDKLNDECQSLEKELNKWKQLYQQEKSKRIKPEYDNTFGEDKYDMKDDKKFTVKKEEKKEYREHSDDYDDMITID